MKGRQVAVHEKTPNPLTCLEKLPLQRTLEIQDSLSQVVKLLTRAMYLKKHS